jgi:oligosaccharide repeat unit polymerase
LSITGLKHASFNPADILSVLNSGSVVEQIRYERQNGFSLIFQTVYLSLLPFAYYFFRASGKLWYLCLYIPLAIVSLAHLTRASLIVQLLILGAYEAIYGNNKIRIGIIFVFFLLLFFGLSGLRGDFSFDKFSTLASLLASTLSSYYFGTLVAFSNWIELIPRSELFSFEFSGLAALFPGVGKLLQLAGFNFPVSEYQYDAISISNYDNIYTNVFSSFRPIIESLGVFGLLIYGFLHGVMSTWLIDYAVEQSDSSTMIAPLAIAYNLYFVVYPLFLFGYFLLSRFILFFFRVSSRRRLST